MKIFKQIHVNKDLAGFHGVILSLVPAPFTK